MPQPVPPPVVVPQPVSSQLALACALEQPAQWARPASVCFCSQGACPGAGAACGVVCGAACASCTSGASCASCASGSCSVGSILFNYTWSRYNTKDKDDPRSRTTLPSRSVRRKRMCLGVTGALRAMKCPSSEPVSTMVPTPLFSVILDKMSSPRLPSTLLALASWAQRR